MFNIFVSSPFVRDHPYFISESLCLIDHFSSTCQAFGDADCPSGRHTFIEDASDLEGLRQAHYLLTQKYSVGQLASLAFPDLPYTLEQIFFYAFASIECVSNEDEEDLRNGTRSPSNIRVNGVLSQMPEFTKAFNCFDGEPMSAPDQSVCYLFGQNAISNANSSFSDASNSSNTRNHRFSSNRMSLLDLEVLIDELES
ncbi:hypothetical protein PRIPAC_97171 [Pristionchus pacificus]|nr:hypothetical protein PRIPAC_97171 [Pristionchus pacificus]